MAWEELFFFTDNYHKYEFPTRKIETLQSTSDLGGKYFFTDHWLPNPGYLDGTSHVGIILKVLIENEMKYHVVRLSFPTQYNIFDKTNGRNSVFPDFKVNGSQVNYIFITLHINQRVNHLRECNTNPNAQRYSHQHNITTSKE